MAETLEQRQERVARDREQEARNAEALAAEEKRQVDLHRRATRATEGEKAAAGPPENKALAGPAENKGTDSTTNALTGVNFASDAAAEEAIRAGLTAAAFRGRKPSGARGFTVADVREIVGGAG